MIPSHLRFYKPMQPIILNEKRKKITKEFIIFSKTQKYITKIVRKFNKKEKEMDNISTNSWVSINKID